ncbi:MAG TPA: hypothetical protein DCL31_00915 [Clostridium sp.]|nr:hypothetical protein [Clostridium sp.]
MLRIRVPSWPLHLFGMFFRLTTILSSTLLKVKVLTAVAPLLSVASILSVWTSLLLRVSHMSCGITIVFLYLM